MVLKMIGMRKKCSMINSIVNETINSLNEGSLVITTYSILNKIK